MARITTRSSAAALLLLAALLIPAPPSPAHTEQKTEHPPAVEDPAALAERFGRAFEAREFDTIEAFFAPDARVSRVVAHENAPAGFISLTSEAWLETTRREHAKLSDIRLDVHDTRTLQLDFAATVSILFSFTCRVGDRSFVSHGIDTYQMVKVDGEWKVKHYTYVDRLSQKTPSST